MGNSAASAAVIGVHLLLFIAATPQDAQSTRGAVELDCGKLEMRGINSRKWGEMILKTHSCQPYVFLLCTVHIHGSLAQLHLPCTDAREHPSLQSPQLDCRASRIC